jgi:hypothetical protein
VADPTTKLALGRLQLGSLGEVATLEEANLKLSLVGGMLVVTSLSISFSSLFRLHFDGIKARSKIL